MTEKEKNLVAEYMAWETTVLNWWRRDDSGIVLVSFDLNDAGLCVKKMQRQEDWDDFITYVEADDTECHTWSQFFAWLYDADYFFEAMAAWLKEEKR
jgi:hypothetical protein